MTGSTPILASQRRRKRGLSLVEVVISMLIVAVMLTAALKTVAAGRLMQKSVSDRTRGNLLAEQLMSEIIVQNYADPTSGVTSFGIDDNDSLSDSRRYFDDVDDYHNWTSSPPEAKDGTAISDSTGWRRSVKIAWVKVAKPGVTSASNTGVKRITITVTRAGKQVATLTALRTNAADEADMYTARPFEPPT